MISNHWKTKGLQEFGMLYFLNCNDILLITGQDIGQKLRRRRKWRKK